MSRTGILMLGLVFIFICATVQAQEQGLVLYLAFEEGSGAVAADLSGKGNDGAITGTPKWADGIAGQGLECDGKVTIDCGMDKSLDIPKNITTSFWINPGVTIDDTGSRLNIIYMHWGPMFAFNTGWGAKKSALTYWYDGPTPKPTIHSDTAVWEKGEWYYIVGTYDGAVSRLYVNAVEEASIDCTGDILERDQALKVGAGYVGVIDEVKLYSTALSVQQINDNFDNPTAAVDAAGKLPLTWGQIKGAF